MASTRATHVATDHDVVNRAILWAQTLAGDFARVALFAVQGTQATLRACHGFAQPHASMGNLSLLEQGPLRWTLEAAAPLIGAGRAPGGGLVALHLGIGTPRAYAVLPYIQQRKLVALAYVDHAQEPLPMSALAQVLEHLAGAPPFTRRRPQRTRALRRPAAAAARRQARQPTQPAGDPPADFRPPTTPAEGEPALPPSTVWPPRWVAGSHTAEVPQAFDTLLSSLLQQGVADTPPSLPPIDRPVARPRPRHWQKALAALIGSLVLSAAVVLVVVLPTPQQAKPVVVEVSAAKPLSAIARALRQAGLIREPHVFVWLARLSGLDRHLRAGNYTINTGLWPWQVLGQLHHGQVQTVRVTIPEGLTLQETAALLAKHGLMRAEDFVQAARDPQLLQRFHIEASNAEGFLFPETYRVVRGVSARDMVQAMLQQFFSRLNRIAAARGLSQHALYDRVILASLVEREAYDKDELRRVAGVFLNRLNNDMRLESCASVQYVLGRSKERLLLDDVRVPSPYNTYLNLGLPPGPIANPGERALAAALDPEGHDFRFFFALDDGSHKHYFSRTFAEHQKMHRSLGRKPSHP